MTLTQTAIFTKRALLFTLALFILGITSFIGYQIWHARYLASLPVPEDKPDIKYGVLPHPDFPQAAVSSSNFSYTLDTQTGGLPAFRKIEKVFFVPKAYATFAAPEKSLNFAQKFNFRDPPEMISETQYLFRDQGRHLTVDLDSGNFSYLKEATPSTQSALLGDATQLIQDFKNFLSSLGILKDDLKNGQAKIRLLKLEGNRLDLAQSRSEASFAQIFLWPQNLNKMPIITGNFQNSLISAIVSSSAHELENYLALNFIFWPIDQETFATYPIKSSQQAFDDLRSGKGMVVITPAKPQVSITSVYLAYYQSENYSSYLQPIYVFEGPGFVALLPAITEQFINPAKK